MGKFNKNKKKPTTGLEIVPKVLENEVPLPESRKSDDAPLKKVNKKAKYLKTELAFIFYLLLS